MVLKPSFMKRTASIALFVLVALFIGIPLGTAESLGPSSRRTGLAISEIMYNPARRDDGRNLEFIELFNSQPWFEDISGYRLSGAVEFTFPPGTLLPARSLVVIAEAPADVRSAYGITNVAGPYLGSLHNDTETVRLLHRNGAVLLEVTYSDEPPWPAAADGAGHSLVLAQPSYGENNPLAWAASDQMGGSPGTFEPPPQISQHSALINEILVRENAGERSFIELFNRGLQSVDLSGCALSDTALADKFVFPTSTTISPHGFLSILQTQLGFDLNPAGGTVYLKNAERTRVLDAVRYGGQSLGISLGRTPDGASAFRELARPMPGAANRNLLVRDIVINEIMYAPISGNPDDEYIELYNQGAEPADLSDWRFLAGINFTFPAKTILFPDNYLVVAKNAARLRTNYPHLTAANTLGDFQGRLSNRGQRIALARPERIVSLNSTGVTTTNIAYVAVDEVTYGTGGRWGKWADGGGSSLELIDPRSDHRLAGNWADSDETWKSAWTTIETQGVLDNGMPTADSLHVLLMGIGECLIDDVEVIGPGGTNRISNPSFDKGLAGWVPQGSLGQSSVEPNRGVGASPCLHVRATHRGDTGANRIRTKLTASLSPNSTATLRAKARWLCGFPEVLLRLRGNYLEAPATLSLPRNLGTPGARNSRATINAGPAIFAVEHHPLLPATNQSVTVTARVHDPDGVGSVLLKYRADPAVDLITVPLLDDGVGEDEMAGDGIYSGTIPKQASGVLVAFRVEAEDRSSSPALTRFPSDAPARECLVRFGEPVSPGGFGTYRLWITQATASKWGSRPKLSNEPLDGTFVYGDERVIYNMGALYSGSPFHSPGYSTPTGSLCNYIMLFPDDDALLGVTDFKLTAPGNNPGDDDTAQREETSYWIAAQLGLPFNYQRNVHLFVNGVRRGRIFEDSQIANSEFLSEWMPEDDEGDLFKIAGWFEFDDAASGFQTTWATLQPFVTTGGKKKLARYRWNWQKRGSEVSTSDYTNLFELVDAVNAPAASYTARVESKIDVDEWVRTFAVEHIVGNWDSYGNNNGQNMFAYKPTQSSWRLFIWDLDIVLGGGADGATTSLFKATDPVMTRFISHPPFRRAYWRALQDAANGPLQGPALNALLDAKYAAFRTNGVSATAPTAIKSYVTSRRNYILQQLRTVAANFSITSSRGDDFSIDQDTVTLTGTAPIEVASLQVNGRDYPTTWTTVTNWSVQVPLRAGWNALSLDGRNRAGDLLTNNTSTINVTFTGPEDAFPDHVVINEWMASNTKTLADPRSGQFSDWFELYNPTANTVDLGGYSLANSPTNTARFVIPAGTTIGPGGFLLVWADKETKQNGPNRDLHVDFKLNQSGDAIALFSPDGRLVDDLEFGVQASDVSEGRWPDGRSQPFYMMSIPSPKASNILGGAGVTPIKLLGVTWGSNGPVLTWEATNGSRYHVQFKNSLEETAWHNLAGDIIATDAIASKIDSTADPAFARFYRVQVVK